MYIIHAFLYYPPDLLEPLKITHNRNGVPLHQYIALCNS